MKTTISLIMLFAVILGGGYLWSKHQTDEVIESSSSMSTTTAASATTGTSTVAAPSSSSGSGSNQVTPTTVSSYTLAQVSTHNNANSCWAAVSGNVYNLTDWISKHPGGAARILSICGKDGTQAYSGQHGADPRAQAMIATFKIGVLAQ